jgi:sensor histidine kinase YesM
VTSHSANGFDNGIGIGQRAVLERLQSAYGTNASMQIASGNDGGYHVVLRMPAHSSES